MADPLKGSLPRAGGGSINNRNRHLHPHGAEKNWNGGMADVADRLPPRTAAWSPLLRVVW
jgi:hypothetical protein